MSIDPPQDTFGVLINPVSRRIWCALLLTLGVRALWIGLEEGGGSFYLNIPVGLALVGSAAGLWKPYRWALYALAIVLWVALLVWASWFVFDFGENVAHKSFWLRLLSGLAVLFGIGGTLIALHRDFRQKRH